MAQGMTYLDFELQVGGDGPEYTVGVLRSPAGEVSESAHFPFSQLALQNQLLTLQNALLQSGGVRRRAPTAHEETVRDFGQSLFDFLFPGEVRSLYRTSQSQAEQRGMGLRLKLRVTDPQLASLPWEYLYDRNDGEYVTLSTYTPLIRYLNLTRTVQPLAVDPPLRILGMIASPEQLQGEFRELKVEVERQRVERALQPLVAAGRVELHWLPGQTWQDLQRALGGGPWHIFHFIGHGAFDANRDEGLIVLANKQGGPAFLTATQLGRLLANHRSLRLAVLNACEGAMGGSLDIYSSTASILMRRGLPAVVAMQYEITDLAAIEFTAAFYEWLAQGAPIDLAVTQARVAVSLSIANSLEWGTPVLHMRAPDGVLFAPGVAEAPTGAAEPEALVAETQEPQTPEVEPPNSQISEVSKLTMGEPNPTVVEVQAIRLPRRAIEFDWAPIPAGEFTMGSDKSKDKLAYDNEQPQHQLYLPEFYIARTPVTNAQYKLFVDAAGQSAPSHWIDGRIPSGKDDHPVVNVNWHDALAFCTWAGVQLPSEAQWEKAARGADGRIYPWGDNPPVAGLCNFKGYWKETTSVGDYPQGASPYGCLDMTGNVWEWTSTLLKDYPYKADYRREDAAASGYRVLRGGSFVNSDQDVRCACRNTFGKPSHGGEASGFRVVSPSR